MADLNPQAVHQFWKEFNDPTIYRVIAFMEGVENWAVDGNPEAEEALTKLSEQLARLTGQDLSEEDRFVEVLANLKTGRCLRLLQALDTANPGAASKLLIHAEEESEEDDETASFFLQRNIVFERLRLLSRVFSKERFALVLKALEGEE